jgi:predicted regulator of Ras-like GTPase activity (Roadblock/LC7/MglB family)
MAARAACASVAHMDVGAALAELKELSTQIDVVLVSSRAGELEASTASGQTAVKLARLAADIVSQAEQVRTDMGREGLAQLQAATPDGSVFAVLDGDRMAVATTGPDPTVGLVFYDLKTLLRQIDRGDDPQPAADEAARVAGEESAEAGDA